MRHLLFLAMLVGCPPLTDEDCILTTGDNCTCELSCMTEKELEAAQRNGVCDLGCPEIATPYSCVAENGECVRVTD